MILFVAGNSRSGTTMMSRILSNHPDVFAFHELHYFDEIVAGTDVSQHVNSKHALRLFSALCRNQRGGYFGESSHADECFSDAKLQASKIDSSDISNIFSAFLHFEAERNGRKIPCEHTPQNLFVMDQLLEAFPDSKWILMVRDPRDVLLSQKFKWKRRKHSGGKIPFWEAARSRANYSPLLMPRIWNKVMNQVEKFQNHASVLIVRFEDVLANPEKEIRRICLHTGLQFQPSMVNVPAVGSSQTADEPGKIAIDASKKGQWREGELSKTEIHLCEKTCHDFMIKWGYEISGITSDPLSIARHYLWLPVKSLLILVMNRRRFIHWLRRM